ncbi:hypothetical protein TSOC_002141, partial [Tetrabaena socialis]
VWPASVNKEGQTITSFGESAFSDGPVLAMQQVVCSGSEARLEECSFVPFRKGTKTYSCDEWLYFRRLPSYSRRDTYEDDYFGGDSSTSDKIAGGVFCRRSEVA